MKDTFVYSLGHVLTWLVSKIFFRLKSFGPGNVPAQGPVLICSNHASYLDPIFIGSPVLQRQVAYLARDTLFRNRFFGWMIERCHAYPVKRGAADLDAFRKALWLLETGAALVLFPEGTRTTDGALRPAKRGAGYLALKSGAPVVPVYVKGSFEAWPKGRRSIRPRPVAVYFGEPFLFPQYSGQPVTRENTQAASDEIMKKIAELKQKSETSA